ncbi:integrase [Planomonospora sp. ID91781]|nr:integrase [Planomonospora sp. ID91781]
MLEQAEAWLRHLRDGGPRDVPKARLTVAEYARVAAPILLQWSQSFDDLREITPQDVTDVLNVRSVGRSRSHALVVLRSLFRFLHRTRRIFHDPTSRLKPGKAVTAALLPLKEHRYEQVIAAASTPLQHVVLALAAIHAASRHDIRNLMLEDFDLGNRHIIINKVRRHLDDLTRQALLAYLEERRIRWPRTANPHLLVSSHTAMDTRRVSSYFLTQLFKGLIGIDQLRQDRQLEEALSQGADPLHLAAVFGVAESTAMRYADAARKILQEEYDIGTPGRC